MVLSVTIWFAAIVLAFQFDGTRPTGPDRAVGRVYTLNTHGHIVYLTLGEIGALYGLMFTGLLGAVLVIAVVQRRSQKPLAVRAPRSGFSCVRG